MNNGYKKQNADSLRVNEIFFSIQGESTYAGRPCVFVRLTYCNLRCSYCDSEYAFFEGQEKTLHEIITEIEKYGCRLVEITGGEPLLQKNIHRLMKMLCDRGYEMLIETGGHMDIAAIDSQVVRIMDIKCPGSGEVLKVRWENLENLTSSDQIKFVIADREDYDWAKSILGKYELNKKCTVLMSPVFGKMNNKELCEWILKDQLHVRFQIQLHKYIWDPQQRSV